MKTRSFDVTVALCVDGENVDYNMLDFTFRSKKTGLECGRATLTQEGAVDFDFERGVTNTEEVRQFMRDLCFQTELSKKLHAIENGKRKSKAKTKAARENGKLGGRPKQSAN